MKKCIIFITILISSVFLFSCSSQEGVVVVEKTIDEDGNKVEKVVAKTSN